MECPTCGSHEIELIESSGHAVCIQCGTVLEENTIVSSVEFQESGDRSHVIGQFVSATSSKVGNMALDRRAYGSASRGNSRYGFSRESREATLANARRNIAQVASSLRLPSYFIDRAQRLYSLALQRNFVYGRRQMHIVATVLYTICRQEKSPHLLIDFSDVLQLTKLLNLNLMIVDPSLYIHRFATRLELGDKVGPVSTTALRIVSRMKKDWINTGRRPDGVCAAAMLLACRSYDIMKDISDMAGIFRVSIATIKKRLIEFQNTPAAQLTLLQFHQHDFQSELDPPIFMKQQQKSASQRGLRVTYDLSDGQSTEATTNLVSVEPLDCRPNEVLFNQRGQQVQRLIIDGVEIMVPLPPVNSVATDHDECDTEVVLTDLPPSPQPQIASRRRASLRRLDKDQRRRELYSSIYSEMSEVMDASVEGSVKGIDDEDDIEETESFPQLIATQELNQPLANQNPTPSETSFNGSRKRIRQLADALYLEAQDVERHGQRRRESTTDPIQSQSIPNAASTQRSYIIVRGDDSGSFNDSTDVDFDPDVDSHFLTQEEQKKKSAIWEKMHRQFLDERLRKRLAKERGENQTPGTSLNKGKIKKELTSQLDSLHSNSWGNFEAPTASIVNTTTKKIRIGASIDSAVEPTTVEESKAAPKTTEKSVLGSIAATILEEGKDGKEDDEEVEEDAEGEGYDDALVYDYGGGMDDYDDEGDDEYY